MQKREDLFIKASSVIGILIVAISLFTGNIMAKDIPRKPPSKQPPLGPKERPPSPKYPWGPAPIQEPLPGPPPLPDDPNPPTMPVPHGLMKMSPSGYNPSPGGVYMAPNPKRSGKGGVEIKEKVLKSRPSSDSLSWPVDIDISGKEDSR